MLTTTISSQVAGLHYQLLDTDAHIDRALDRGSRREFMLWAKRRASLASRLQNLLDSRGHGLTEIKTRR